MGISGSVLSNRHCSKRRGRQSTVYNRKPDEAKYPHDGPQHVYVLELSLHKVKQDGSYHRLKVKVDQDGLEITSAPRAFRAEERKKVSATKR